MLVYKKENGFPVDLSFDTEKCQDENEEWIGYKSIIKI